MTKKSDKEVIENTTKAIDELLKCFAHHPAVSLETFVHAREKLEELKETIAIAGDINDILDF